ncbi:hypothetical protein AB836_01710 [Rickettsiales bacterium (ex Bugula neritina AB1)]|nr:hypothetical protein AB836_01710 [Rickettsiales bacterium (ex Bugula neritina AB1)]
MLLRNTLEKEEWQKNSNKIHEEIKNITDNLDKYQDIINKFNNIKELLELKDDNLLEILIKEIKSYKEELDKYFMDLLLTKEEQNNCFLEIQSGKGGVDAEDLAHVLLKTYQKWTEKTQRKYEILDISYTDCGLKFALLKIIGKNSLGLLKSEKGTHRFVRYSPFNALEKRQTSFVSVNVYGIVEKNKVIIKNKDLMIDTYKSSSAGGQHVNKTDSAVRILHVPSGIVVSCQNQRSQLENKNTALEILQIRLNEKEEEKLNLEKEKTFQNKNNISWGSQIRSYTLNPYKLIKDLRSNLEISNVNVTNFLEGNINEFLYKNLLFFKKNY